MTFNQAWPPHPLPELRRQLNELALAVADRSTDRADDEQIWLTRFLVVRTCGYLEQVVHETIRSFISAKSGGMVRSFAHSWLARSKNPSIDNMLEITGRLDAALADDLRSRLEDNDGYLQREISLLVDRRHKIAHGTNEGLGTVKALSLKSDAEIVADWFIENLDPHRPLRTGVTTSP